MENIVRLVPLLISLGILLFVGVYSFSHSRRSEARALTFLVLMQFLWVLGYLFETGSAEINAKIYWDYLQYYPSAVWPFAFIYFCVVYANVPIRRPAPFWIPISIGPVFIMLFVGVERWHGQIYDDAHIVAGELRYTFPPLLYIGFVWLTGLLILGMVFLAQAIRKTPVLFHRQQILVLVGNLFPLAGTFFSMSGVRFFGIRDTAPFTFAISNVLVGYALFKEHMFRVVPVARECIVDAMYDFSLVTNEEGILLDVNRPGRALLNRPLRISDGKTLAQTFDFWPELIQLISKLQAGKQTSGVIEHPSGVYYEVTQNVLKKRGAVTSYVYIGHDVTVSLKQERELERLVDERTENLQQMNVRNLQLQRRLQGIVDNLPFVLVAVDSEGLVTCWNNAAVEETGITAADALGKNVSDVWKAHMKDIVSLRRVVSVGKSESFRDLVGERHFVVVVFPIQNGAALMREDISAQVKFQEAIAQTEKLVAVGSLASGMAHEINNPLAGIIQASQVIAQRLTDPSPKNRDAAFAAGTTFDAIRSYLSARNIDAMLERMQESEQRVSEIVSNMLSLTNNNGDVYEPTDIQMLVEETLRLAKTEPAQSDHCQLDGLIIETDFPADLRWPSCNRGKIQQVVLCLLRNAADAACSMKSKRAPRIIIRLRNADWFEIHVEDNGPGIPTEMQRRIFNPFFTTKGINQGMGLGLSISYFIVTHNHRGELTVNSSTEGTCFTVKLPLST